MTIESFVMARLAIKNERVRQFMAEFLGSFILALVGMGAAHQTTLSGGSSTHGAVAGGLGVALGIFASANASGGHINPAVTTGFLVLGRMGKGLIGNIIGALVYYTAQFFGMFSAAAVVYAVYYSGEQSIIESLDPDNSGLSASEAEQLVCLYATCPQNDYVNNQGSMFFDQVVGAAILVTSVFATTDPFNANPPGMAPLIIGLSATAMGLAFGPNAGGAINSARDFGPRIFASIVYGDVAFTGVEGTNSYQFMWIPLFGPLVGGACAAFIYLFLVMAHWPQNRTNQVQDEGDEESVNDAAL